MTRTATEPEESSISDKTGAIGSLHQTHSVSMRQTHTKSHESKVLATAFLNAGNELGLSQTDLSVIVGKDRTSIARYGIDPKTKAGELALIFIEFYQSVFVLMGGNVTNMRHLMHTNNLLTNGVPARQLHSISGLMRVHNCFEALSSRI